MKIGYVMPDYDDSYGPRLYYGIERECADQDCLLIIRRSLGSREEEEAAIRFLVEAGVDGIIIWPASYEKYNDQILKLVFEKFPLVLLDRPLKGLNSVSVSTNNVKASYKAAEFLMGLGHDKIGFISPPAAVTTVLEERVQGYIQCHAEHGIMVQKILELSDTTYYHSGLNSKSNQDAIASYLDANRHLSAVIAAEYSIGVLAYQAAARLGIQVPEQLSIVCFDHPTHWWGTPMITHVLQDELQMGKTSLRTLLGLIHENKADSSMFDSTIVEGSTTTKFLSNER
ncbi:substrate-binding domain-containing protein [Paenibacillus albus]|uniref:LacI family transcriptional regulator n=1 Tax=Paenibacillus albus TaxID=2495582 RepID=A0A3Q8X4J2_9BACL|nr:substrate-binding domain-containing protein [Paenibacillus albus]AZN40326.1 LacI family transcriptional regulator [Paenibacillus albus]